MSFFEWFENIDVHLLRYLNSFHSSLADGFWWSITDTIAWLPFFLMIIFVIIANKGRESILIFVSLAIVVLLCDQLSGVLKDVVGRLRPSHDPSLMYDIHIVNGYRGGLYSFVSSHAANTFGVALFLILLVRNSWFSMLMLLWARLNGFSRIYLGVHFPFDVIVGGMLGLFLGWACFKFFSFLKLRLPAFASVSSERSLSKYTSSGFVKRHLWLVAAALFVSLFFFYLVSGFVLDFMP